MYKQILSAIISLHVPRWIKKNLKITRTSLQSFSQHSLRVDTSQTFITIQTATIYSLLFRGRPYLAKFSEYTAGDRLSRRRYVIELRAITIDGNVVPRQMPIFQSRTLQKRPVGPATTAFPALKRRYSPSDLFGYGLYVATWNLLTRKCPGSTVTMLRTRSARVR